VVVKSAGEDGLLYESELIQVIQSWVVAMSSAQLRSFRHTATVIALEIESALASEAARIEKSEEIATRQRDAEHKKKKGSDKEKSRAAKLREIKFNKAKVNEYLKEFFDG
jgi:cohesin complex subunit SA-1/2